MRDLNQCIVRISSAQHSKTPSGTGFFVDKSGYVATCFHVIEGMQEIWISCESIPEAIKAELVPQASDGAVDFALLTVTLPKGMIAPVLPIGDEWEHGGDIYTAGYQYFNTKLFPAHGKILGPASYEGITIQALALEHADHIERGISGAPAWFEQKQFIIGLISAKWSKANTGFAILFRDIREKLGQRPEVSPELIRMLNSNPSLTAPPEQLLDPEGRLVMRSLRLLAWVLFKPAKWAEHLQSGGLQLLPMFSLTQLSETQWKSGYVRRLIGDCLPGPLLVILFLDLVLALVFLWLNPAGELQKLFRMNLAMSALIAVVTGAGLSLRIGVASGMAASIMSGILGAIAAWPGAFISNHGTISGGVTGGVAVGAALAISLTIVNYEELREENVTKYPINIVTLVRFAGAGVFLALLLGAMAFSLLVALESLAVRLTGKPLNDIPTYFRLTCGAILGYAGACGVLYLRRRFDKRLSYPSSVELEKGLLWVSTALGALAAAPSILNRPSVPYGMSMGTIAGIVLTVIISILHVSLEGRVGIKLGLILSQFIAMLVMILLFSLGVFSGVPERDLLVNVSITGLAGGFCITLILPKIGQLAEVAHSKWFANTLGVL